MKAQILKIAGVKSEKEFYKKFPSEEAFMKKHGKELKKAASGLSIGNKAVAKENANLALGMLANNTGTLVGLGETLADKYGRQTDTLNAYGKISDLMLKIPKAPIPKQQYVRPEYSQVINPQKYGVPMGEDGLSVGGNPTEIQNTYDPYDIYTDLEYTPLNDNNPKQYAFGGDVANSPVSAAGGGAAGGFDASKFMGAAGSIGGGLGSLLGGSNFEQTEEGQLAGDIGGILGTAAAGPVGGLIGKTIFSGVGGYFGGKKNKELKEANNKLSANIATGTFANTLQGDGFKSYVRNGAAISSYEEGGYMNPEYNPQVIAKFGDYSMDQLLAPPHDADMLRSGGHLAQVNYTPPSAAAMYTGRDLPYQMEDGGQMMAMGGELQTLWGGDLETISRNPYDDSEIVMPKGQSHEESDGRGRTGIGIKYGSGGYATSDEEASAEVERNEPMMKMKEPMYDGGNIMANGGSEDKLFVFGNMIEDKTKKKYKVLAKEIAEDNAKQNKIMASAAISANDDDDRTVFGQFKRNSNLAKIIGPDMKLQQNSMQLKEYAAKQNAILETAEEYNLVADALAKGKIVKNKETMKHAEFGAKLEQFKPGGKKAKAAVAQTQTSVRDLGNLSGLYDAAIKTKDAMAIGKFQRAALNTLGADEIQKLTGAKNTKKFVDGILGKGTNAIGRAVAQKMQSHFLPADLTPNAAVEMPALPPGEQPQEQRTIVGDWVPAEERVPFGKKVESPAAPVAKPAQGDKWYDTALTGLNSMLPHLVPSNQMDLDAAQTAPEMYAMATNALEPVYAQTFHPMSAQPYSISLQDQRNQITADSRAAQRMLQGNPSAGWKAAADASELTNRVNAEEFRANQGEQARVAEKNRDISNDAQIKNLAIYQDQAGKMAQARSNTKAENKAILDSLAAKRLQNQSENRKMAILQNTYNYRYTPNGVAYNVNPSQQWNMSGNTNGGVAPAGYEFETILKRKKSSSSDEPTVSRNGAIVKAIKGL